MKLQIFMVGKDLAHACAYMRPTTRQMPQGVVLARLLARDLFTVENWAVVCAETTGIARPRQKRSSVGQQWRQSNVAKVRRWLRLLRRKSGVLRRRTVFSLLRRPASKVA